MKMTVYRRQGLHVFFWMLMSWQTQLTLGQRIELVEEKCTGNLLSLSCPFGYVINVMRVEFGETDCYAGLGTPCCIKFTDCTRTASARRQSHVHLTCDGKQSCSINALSERIDCLRTGTDWSEFERVRYSCIGQSSRTTAAVVSSPSASLLWSNIFTLSPSSSSSSDVSVDSQENGGDNMTMMENTFNDYQHPGSMSAIHTVGIVAGVIGTISCVAVVIATVVYLLRNRKLQSHVTHQLVVLPPAGNIQQSDASTQPKNDPRRFTLAAGGTGKCSRSVYEQLVMSYKSTKDSILKLKYGDVVSVSAPPKKI